MAISTNAAFALIFIIAVCFAEMVILFTFRNKIIGCPAKQLFPNFESSMTHTANQSLTLSVGTIAAIAFMLSSMRGVPEIEGAIVVMGAGLAFFLLSFKMDKIIEPDVKDMQLQDIFQHYGIVLLTSGLALAYSVFTTDLTRWVAIIPIAFVILRVPYLHTLYKKLDHLSQHAA
jgi:hypothetical protein